MSARVQGVERTCAGIRVFSLHIFNVLDICIGGFLVGFALYMMNEVGEQFFKNPNTAWLAIASVALGALMLAVSFFSLCSIMVQGFLL